MLEEAPGTYCGALGVTLLPPTKATILGPSRDTTSNAWTCTFGVVAPRELFRQSQHAVTSIRRAFSPSIQTNSVSSGVLHGVVVFSVSSPDLRWRHVRRFFLGSAPTTKLHQFLQLWRAGNDAGSVDALHIDGTRGPLMATAAPNRSERQAMLVWTWLDPDQHGTPYHVYERMRAGMHTHLCAQLACRTRAGEVETRQLEAFLHSALAWDVTTAAGHDDMEHPVFAVMDVECKVRRLHSSTWHHNFLIVTASNLQGLSHHFAARVARRDNAADSRTTPTSGADTGRMRDGSVPRVSPDSSEWLEAGALWPGFSTADRGNYASPAAFVRRGAPASPPTSGRARRSPATRTPRRPRSSVRLSMLQGCLVALLLTPLLRMQPASGMESFMKPTKASVARVMTKADDDTPTQTTGHWPAMLARPKHAATSPEATAAAMEAKRRRARRSTVAQAALLRSMGRAVARSQPAATVQTPSDPARSHATSTNSPILEASSDTAQASSPPRNKPSLLEWAAQSGYTLPALEDPPARTNTPGTRATLSWRLTSKRAPGAAGSTPRGGAPSAATLCARRVATDAIAWATQRIVLLASLGSPGGGGASAHPRGGPAVPGRFPGIIINDGLDRTVSKQSKQAAGRTSTRPASTPATPPALPPKRKTASGSGQSSRRRDKRRSTLLKPTASSQQKVEARINAAAEAAEKIAAATPPSRPVRNVIEPPPPPAPRTPRERRPLDSPKVRAAVDVDDSIKINSPRDALSPEVWVPSSQLPPYRSPRDPESTERLHRPPTRVRKANGAAGDPEQRHSGTSGGLSSRRRRRAASAARQSPAAVAVRNRRKKLAAVHSAIRRKLQAAGRARNVNWAQVLARANPTDAPRLGWMPWLAAVRSHAHIPSRVVTDAELMRVLTAMDFSTTGKMEVKAQDILEWLRLPRNTNRSRSSSKAGAATSSASGADVDESSPERHTANVGSGGHAGSDTAGVEEPSARTLQLCEIARELYHTDWERLFLLHQHPSLTSAAGVEASTSVDWDGFRAAVLEACEACPPPPPQTDLMMLFGLADTDGSGRVSLAELQDCMAYLRGLVDTMDDLQALPAVPAITSQVQKSPPAARPLSAMAPLHWDPEVVRRLRSGLRAAAYTVGGVNWSRLFHHYDVDGSGDLSLKEFRAAMRRDAHIPRHVVSDGALLQMFCLVDADGNGSISSGEFLRWVNAPLRAHSSQRRPRKKVVAPESYVAPHLRNSKRGQSLRQQAADDLGVAAAKAAKAGGALGRARARARSLGWDVSHVQQLRRKLAAAAYSKGGVDWGKLFRLYDTDKSGDLGWDEFRRAVRRDAHLTAQVVSEASLMRLFCLIDTDGSGTVEMAEFHAFVTGNEAQPKLGEAAARRASHMARGHAQRTRTAQRATSHGRLNHESAPASVSARPAARKSKAAGNKADVKARATQSPPAPPHDAETKQLELGWNPRVVRLLRNKFQSARSATGAVDWSAALQPHAGRSLDWDTMRDVVRQDAGIGSSELTNSDVMRLFCLLDAAGEGLVVPEDVVAFVLPPTQSTVAGGTGALHTTTQASMAQTTNVGSRPARGRLTAPSARPPQLPSAGEEAARLVSTGAAAEDEDSGESEELGWDPMVLRRLAHKLRAAAYTTGGVDWTRLFRHYDTDRSGQLEWDEFRVAIRRDARVSRSDVSESDMMRLFCFADKDGGGTVSIEEFVEWLETDVAAATARRGSLTLSPEAARRARALHQVVAEREPTHVASPATPGAAGLWMDSLRAVSGEELSGWDTSVRVGPPEDRMVPTPPERKSRPPPKQSGASRSRRGDGYTFQPKINATSRWMAERVRSRVSPASSDASARRRLVLGEFAHGGCHQDAETYSDSDSGRFRVEGTSGVVAALMRRGQHYERHKEQVSLTATPAFQLHRLTLTGLVPLPR